MSANDALCAPARWYRVGNLRGGIFIDACLSYLISIKSNSHGATRLGLFLSFHRSSDAVGRWIMSEKWAAYAERAKIEAVDGTPGE